MSVNRQAGISATTPCQICHQPSNDWWSIRHPAFEPFAMLTICGKCKDLLIAAVAAARKE